MNKQNRNIKDKEANWYGIVLDGIAKAFSKFVGIFKKHGFIYVTLVLILFVSCYTLIINPIRIDRLVEKRLESMYQTERDKEVESINKRLKADEIIGGIMTKIVDKFPEVQRILLLESHNSIQTLTQTDILFFSCTAEMLTPNSRHLTYLSEDLQRQIRYNLMGEILNTLKYREYMYYDSVQGCNHPSHRIIQKLKSVGDKEAILIPFKDRTDLVQMVLVISGENLHVDDIISYIGDHTKEIESSLM